MGYFFCHHVITCQISVTNADVAIEWQAIGTMEGFMPNTYEFVEVTGRIRRRHFVTASSLDEARDEASRRTGELVELVSVDSTESARERAFFTYRQMI